ncbi:putative oxidoreductase C-terminal domain-containing protein [uncultured Proteiniphilum sp.]|uniref:putative oxidoreductase C-terminal domain-containing protein n=1 Tax=uncultured Proteiniphilum sp. TaxID=497637 RepID=UPI0026169227|nr:putative oxidoreductase C-terminal domain-containing protein [uncultured Proteiniphilum sp.]
MKKGWLIIAVGLIFFSCMQKNNTPPGDQTVFTGEAGEIKLIVPAPGHFHANLLQKSAILQVDDSVFVYAAPKDAGLKQYLSAIESFNQRDENPTNWQTVVYIGDDFLNKMITDKKGNVVVLAGNNKEKTEYILSVVDAGLNVLSDKPMAINREDFLLLEEAYANAEAQNVLLYDMMTERYDMLNIIEKELINDREFCGELQPGTPEDPAVYMESVHHFYKEVSGVPLIRPAWYYDVEQQGEGIADVTTHLIDLLFWKCFPGQPIDYTRDIGNISSTHWPTEITLAQFTKSTGETAFPDYLQKYLDNSILKVYANGNVHFDVKNHPVSLKVIWNYQAPEGSGDTFMSVIKGTKAILKTVQNKEQNFVKQLYVQKSEGLDENEFSGNLQKAIGKIQTTYPFVSVSPTSNKGEYLINIPVENREGHESHFKYVAESFFNFLANRTMPEWEKNNTLAKYYITTKAVEIAKDRD